MKAFPFSKKHFLIVGDVASEVEVSEDGMNLRDYFAAKAMQAYCSCLEWRTINDWRETAEVAYLMADAMMKARDAKG